MPDKTYVCILLEQIDDLTREIRRLEAENKRLETELQEARDRARLMEDDGK
jgi:cell division septum initiation protein DivIVA